MAEPSKTVSLDSSTPGNEKQPSKAVIYINILRELCNLQLWSGEAGGAATAPVLRKHGGKSQVFDKESSPSLCLPSGATFLCI